LGGFNGEVGIHSGDLLIVDRSLVPRDGQVAIAVVDGLKPTVLADEATQAIAL